MHKVRQYKTLIERRKIRIRAKISGTEQKPRISVFRSNKHIYAQALNDLTSKTLASFSSLNIEKGAKKDLKTKVSEAFFIGEKLAEKLIKNNIKIGVFDRGGYKYHGRVKALAEGVRKGGVQI